MLITSSGIIRNEHKPRAGVTSIHSLASWALDEIDQGIDLTYESFLEELASQGIVEDSPEWYAETDNYETDSRAILFGDWVKNDSGQYEIDQNGKHGYAGEYNSSMGNICVEYSKTTKFCNNTSPCYVMANGDGPCGDLDTLGNTVLAYTLPVEFFNEE